MQKAQADDKEKNCQRAAYRVPANHEHLQGDSTD